MGGSRRKSRIALTIGAALIICGVALLGFLFHSRLVANSPDPSETGVVDDAGFPEVDWEYWQSVNPDIIGWVTVPDTNISLPIVQASADDQYFYLNHDITGAYNAYGCPYLDDACAEYGLDSMLALVYGHHMNDGTMFSAFADFSDREYFDAHRTVLLQTPTSKVRLTVVAADVVNNETEDYCIEFEDSVSYHAWWNEMLGTADVVADDAPNNPAGTVAFCTCSYGPFNGNERTLVYAVRM